MLSFSKPMKYWRLVSLTVQHIPFTKWNCKKIPKFHCSRLAIKEILRFKYQAFITFNWNARGSSQEQPKSQLPEQLHFPPICFLLWALVFNGLSISYKIFRKQDLFLSWTHWYQVSAEMTNWANFKNLK